jgi:hypothetical protein
MQMDTPTETSCHISPPHPSSPPPLPPLGRQRGFFLFPSILSFETINKLTLSVECGIPRPQDAGHLCFRLFFTLKSDPGQESNLKVSTDYLLLQFFYPTILCNCSACNVPPDAGLQKRATFPL